MTLCWSLNVSYYFVGQVLDLYLNSWGYISTFQQGPVANAVGASDRVDLLALWDCRVESERCGPRTVYSCRGIYDSSIHMHTYIHTYLHTHTYIRTHTHTYIHTHIHTHTYIHTHIHTYIHTYLPLLGTTFRVRVFFTLLIISFSTVG